MSKKGANKGGELGVRFWAPKASIFAFLSSTQSAVGSI